MCGIAGCWINPIQTEQILLQSTSVMNDSLKHRGPDDGGVWVDAERGIGLGNRRLSILDLSSAGHQPMISSNGRYVIAYNGEVYNFAEVRKELEAEGRYFRSHTDTEVILEACAHWGIETTINQLNGMFALAIWDRQEHQLTLARDRLGIKPLYYGWCGDTFLFGSELKAICQYPNFVREVDRNSLALFFRHNYIPAPYSVYKNVYKLLPGHLLNIYSPNQSAETICYWSAKSITNQGVAQPFSGDETEALNSLDSLLRDAVRLRMISDVPLGAFLSGGVDSSTVVSLMQAQSVCPVKSFSIGFHESGYNEAKDAKRVAKHLGTDHTELYVTSKEAQEVIPRLASIYDEPFSDSSQIPTFLISQLTRKHVTVSLSGDGGDELFAGYHRYSLGQLLSNRMKWIPRSVRYIGAKSIHMMPPTSWDRLFQSLGNVVPSPIKARVSGDRLYNLAKILSAHSSAIRYHHLVSHWKSPETLVIGASEPITAFTNSSMSSQFEGSIQQMMYLDLITYLPDDILTKVDRASMAVSLEARVPILDHRVVEFAWQLPLSLKLRNDQSKWLLRQVLYQYVPKEFIERPKMGFGIPIDRWLRVPLREWAESLLNESRIQREGFLNPKLVRQKWEEHLSGRQNWHYLLWDVLMFQSWQEQWL